MILASLSGLAELSRFIRTPSLSLGGLDRAQADLSKVVGVDVNEDAGRSPLWIVIRLQQLSLPRVPKCHVLQHGAGPTSGRSARNRIVLEIEGIIRERCMRAIEFVHAVVGAMGLPLRCQHLSGWSEGAKPRQIVPSKMRLQDRETWCEVHVRGVGQDDLRGSRVLLDVQVHLRSSPEQAITLRVGPVPHENEWRPCQAAGTHHFEHRHIGRGTDADDRRTLIDALVEKIERCAWRRKHVSQ